MLVTLSPDLWHRLGLDISPLLPQFVLTTQSWDKQEVKWVASGCGSIINMHNLKPNGNFFYMRTAQKRNCSRFSTLWVFILIDSCNILILSCIIPNIYSWTLIRTVPQFCIQKLHSSVSCHHRYTLAHTDTVHDNLWMLPGLLWEEILDRPLSRHWAIAMPHSQ